MRFIVVTRDYSGLGFAVRLDQEGHEVILAPNPDPADASEAAACSRYWRVGEGLVSKESLSSVLGRREQLRDAYWIWDSNHSLAENEVLRAENFRVLLGGKHAYTMEHDRQACLEFTGEYGLNAPPSVRFENPVDAISFCEEHPDTAYVYKPDTGDNFETFLPEAEDPVE